MTTRTMIEERECGRSTVEERCCIYSRVPRHRSSTLMALEKMIPMFHIHTIAASRPNHGYSQKSSTTPYTMPSLCRENALDSGAKRTNPNQEINTFRTSFSPNLSPFTPPMGSLTHPFSVPIFSLNPLNLSLPYIRPFGNTTGSFSTILFV